MDCLIVYKPAIAICKHFNLTRFISNYNQLAIWTDGEGFYLHLKTSLQLLNALHGFDIPEGHSSILSHCEQFIFTLVVGQMCHSTNNQTVGPFCW